MPGIGPIISSAMVAAIGSGAAFVTGRDYSAWLGLVPKQMSTGDRIHPRTRPRTHLQARQRLLAHALHSSRPGSFWYGRRTGPSTALESGSFAPLSACTLMFRPSPTTRDEMKTLWFMAAALCRHHRSPDCASEQRWLRGHGFKLIPKDKTWLSRQGLREVRRWRERNSACASAIR